MEAGRLELSRLYARFAFGPKAGQFKTALRTGFPSTAQALLDGALSDFSLNSLPAPDIKDLGSRPSPSNIPATIDFNAAVKAQNESLVLWWLDRMALADNPLVERMTWFWHGHWATSIDKVNFALPMLKQNQVLRQFALGNFRAMAHAMLHDGALQIWLDGNDNVVAAPNENLARELMELFILGVNRYTEDDVKALARALTGYQVDRTNGVVNFNAKRHDQNQISLLGTLSTFDGDSAVDLLVSRPDNATFLAERLWFRFISSSEPIDPQYKIVESLANREIAPAVKNIVLGGALSNPNYTTVRPPVEWFIAVCRAFGLRPSTLNQNKQALGYLLKLAQVPFLPPNVGGWPTDEAWLSSSSAQFRISFANFIAKQINFAELSQLSGEERINFLRDLLGVYAWSPRTYIALSNCKDNLVQLVTLAVCSPEFVVSA